MREEIVNYVRSKGWKYSLSPDGNWVRLNSCPICGKTSRKPFAINTKEGTAHCHHGECGWSGGLTLLKQHFGDLVFKLKEERRAYAAPPESIIKELEDRLWSSPALIDKFKAFRCIDEKHIKMFRLGLDERRGVAYPSFQNGKPVCIKFKRRTADGKDIKAWVGPKGESCRSVLYNVHNLRGNDIVYIVEGEDDCIILTQLGYKNVVSIPHGSATLRGEWLDPLESFRDVVIFMDGDPAGQKAAQGLAATIGTDRSRIVEFPQGIVVPPGPWAKEEYEAKDITDLVRAGRSDLIKDLIDGAPIPKHDTVVHVSDFIDEFLEDFKNGNRSRGATTGFPSLDAVIGGRRPGELTIITGNTSCHAPGQGILMYDGSIKKVENILVGDQIMGPDSTPRNVLETHTGKTEMANIIPIKGESFEVTLDHLLTLVEVGYYKKINGKNTYFKSGKLKDISVRDWINSTKTFKHLHKLVYTGVEFNRSNNLTIDPYFLGILLGDGNLTNLTPVFTTVDKVLYDYLESECTKHNCYLTCTGSNGGIDYRIVSKESSYKNCNLITKELRSLGLMGLGSGDKFIPNDYLITSKENRLKLLAGLLDTDGSLSKSKNGYTHIDYITKSEKLSNDIVFLCRSLGFWASVNKCKKSCQGDFTGNYYRIYINGNLSLIPSKLSRKQSTKTKTRTDVLRAGFKVEKSGVGKFFGFSVDGDNRYVLDNFLITHNSGKTTLAFNVAMNVVKLGEPVLMSAFEHGPKKIIEKASSWITGKTRFLGSTNEMTQQDAEYAAKVMKDMPLYIINHYGVYNPERYIECMRYSQRRLMVTTAVLDHLHHCISSKSFETERHDIDRAMLSLRGATEQTTVNLMVVAHPRQKQGEENPSIGLTDLRGSSFISQVADNVWICWRDDNLQKLKPGYGRSIIYVKKTRSECGTVGQVEMVFDMNGQKFLDPLGSELDFVEELGQNEFTENNEFI